MSVRHDLIAERQLLAMTLSGHPTVREKFLALPMRVWHPSTEPVATVLRDRLVREIPTNPLTVAAAVVSMVANSEQADRLRRFVTDAAASTPPLGTWDYYAEQVLTCLTIRDADHAAQVLVQRLETATEPQEVADIVRVARDDLEGVTGNLVTRASEPPVSLQELFDQPEEPYNWLVPGLWERMDRVIITGYEGTGKSFLLAQFALSVAAGIHPFAATVFNREGFRVLVIDCENSQKQITRRYSNVARNIGYIRDAAHLPPVDWSKQVRFVMRPEGVDMTNVQEFARIEQAIAATAPDLVLAGPLYRMHKTNINDEQAARELVDALDRLRVKYQFTLIAEAHVGHVGEATGGRKLRPTGSSLFLRWPEFGYGLRGFGDAQKEEHPSTVELVAWRGARDERHWPDILSHNADLLPWMPTTAYRERYLFSADAMRAAS